MNNGVGNRISGLIQPLTAQIPAANRRMCCCPAVQCTKRVPQIRNSAKPQQTEVLKRVGVGVVVIEIAGDDPARSARRIGHDSRVTSTSQQHERRLAGHPRGCPCTAGRTGVLRWAFIWGGDDGWVGCVR